MPIETGSFRFLGQKVNMGSTSRLLAVVAQIAERFSSGISWHDDMNFLLAETGRALGVDRACLFQTIEINETHLIQDYVFEWVPTPEYKLIGSPLLSMMTRPVDMPGYKELIESRKRGEWQKVLTSKVEPGPLHEILSVQGIKSMLTIPVMVESEWWGTLGFDDCKTERAWSDAEMLLLYEVAHHISSAVLRERLSAQRKQLKVVKEFTGFNTWEFDLKRGRLWCPADLVYAYPVPSETVSFSLLEILRSIHPEDRKPLIKSVKSYLSGGREIVFRHDLRIFMKGGSIRWVQVIGNLQSKKDDSVQRLAGITVDIYHKQVQQSLRQEVVSDPLTGALSRKRFDQKLSLWQKEHSATDRRCSLFLLDLDQFQRVNDKYGHNAGDDLLKHFVKICLSLLREEDQIARIEGDKFAVFLPGIGSEEAKALGNRLRNHVEQTPITVGLESVALSATIGVAVHSKGPINLSNLILRADSVLHIAKQSGSQLLMENELV